MRKFLGRFRPFFVYAGLFSLVINLLLLVPALYMLQVFDRVLTSRSTKRWSCCCSCRWSRCSSWRCWT